MKEIVTIGMIALLCAVAGCGNVSLSGDALVACQQSAMDAYQASVRADADTSTPAWERVYLQENFKQWRSYVRSAAKDAAWGPKLPGEAATQPAGQ